MTQDSSKQASFPFDQKTVWQPNPHWIEASNLSAFMATHGIADLDELQQRSVTDIGWFWDAVMKHLNIEFRHPYTNIVDLTHGPEFPAWCVDGRMNIVHNLLDKWMDSARNRSRTALIWESEEGTTRTLSYEELNAEVCRCAGALRHDGIGKGDAVGLFMPMTPELAIAFLAIIKVGGIILPLFSGYGPQAVATRLNDAGAKVLFTSDGFYRRGREIRLKETADEALALSPSVRRVVVLQRTQAGDVPMQAGRDLLWTDFLRTAQPDATTEDTRAEDTLMIIYTSGTTGRPKGAVHTHCGFPVKAAQDMFHAMDLKPGEIMYWMTDMGWMMGPWLVFGTLAIGATMVFSDGAPDWPDVDRLWDMVHRHQITHLGLSPVLIRTLMPNGLEPVRKHDLSSLRAVASTGSPWDPESWNWVFEHVLQSRKPILNYSGGTEISGGIVCGNFFRPLKPCAFSGPVPGMAADVVDESGQSVREEVGELVIRKPWIGMTRGFWNDRQRYLESYWNRIPGVWLHGDFAAVDRDGLWYILGRSDDTIKVAGKRLGPAEVEAIVNADPQITESAAIGIPHEIKGEEVGIFCVPINGAMADDALRERLMSAVTSELGKPLKPRFIRFCRALPKTRNAKVMRRVVRAVHLGLDPGDVSSLEDPSTLEAIRNAV